MLIEAAFVLPVLMVLLLGIMEFGLVYSTASTAVGSTRTGARLAATSYATAGMTASAQRSAADAIAGAVAADQVALNNAVPIGLTIYRVNPSGTGGAPVGGFPGEGMAGGCSDDCFRYTWNGTSFAYTSGGWSDPDACGLTVDSIGIFVDVRHEYVTKLIGATREVSGHTVMRLEPLPTDQCASS